MIFQWKNAGLGPQRALYITFLRRERVILAKNDNVELEICVKARGGRAARCMGSIVVAEMIAREARRSRTRGPARSRGGARDARTTTPLYAFSRAIDRESLAGLGNSLKSYILNILQKSPQKTKSSTNCQTSNANNKKIPNNRPHIWMICLCNTVQPAPKKPSL